VERYEVKNMTPIEVSADQYLITVSIENEIINVKSRSAFSNFNDLDIDVPSGISNIPVTKDQAAVQEANLEYFKEYDMTIIDVGKRSILIEKTPAGPIIKSYPRDNFVVDPVLISDPEPGMGL